jgi:tetratricopeptide (TPR) repeat protein
MPSAARVEFERSLAVYRRAWEDSGHIYPGINVAWLRRLLAEDRAGRDEALELAARVLSLARRQPSEDLWALLTQADAHVLLGEHDKAEEIYRRARPHCTAQNVGSVVRRLRLVRRVLDGEGQNRWADQRLEEVFALNTAPAPTITDPHLPGQRREIV